MSSYAAASAAAGAVAGLLRLQKHSAALLLNLHQVM
jgi:hypothetical protein